MPELPPFDPENATRRLQDAIRVRSAHEIESLVSTRFHFVSARSLGRMDRRGFVSAALAAEWNSFESRDFRVLELGNVVAVDYRLSQEAALNGRPLPREWVVSDIWAVEDDAWRLVFRHPEADELLGYQAGAAVED